MSDLFSLLLFSFFWVAVCITASHYRQDFDPRWFTALWAGVVGIHAFYIALYLRGVDESLRKLYELFTGREGEMRPELQGAVQYLRKRVVEAWWGLRRKR